MFSYYFNIFLFCVLPIFASKIVEGSQPVLQKTVEALFRERVLTVHPGSCKVHRPTKRQTKMCDRDTGLSTVLTIAKKQAIVACEETFRYDRWNCSLIYNRKVKRSIFNKLYRETAFVYALIAASITHSVAKACATGNLSSCSCVGKFGKNSTWKIAGCGDDFRHGKRVTKNFLDFKRAGNDPVGEILKQDVIIGIDSIGEQLKEVCKCHGFSGSCTTKTCWKRIGPFNSAMGLLKKHYHHAIKRKILNYTTKRAISPKIRNKMHLNKRNLVYLQSTPNLCISTRGRMCDSRHNCATLCCGRGYITGKKQVSSRCRCRMVNCCFVQCDTCVEEVNTYTCK